MTAHVLARGSSFHKRVKRTRFCGFLTLAMPLLLLVSSCGATSSETPAPTSLMSPIQAREAGYDSLALFDDFNDLTTIDVASSGRDKFNWYVDLPFGWPDPHASFRVDNSVLTIDAKAGRYNNGNWSMATKSPGSNAGRSFQYGYFEARLRFDPPSGSQRGWPSFWSLAESRILTRSEANYGELDFFEATDDGRLYSGTIHDFRDAFGIKSGESLRNSVSHVVQADISYADWNTYGCLWEPGRVRWYLNEKLMIDQRYGPQAFPFPNLEDHPKGTYSVLDENPVIVVLGTGEGWALDVDFVKVWR